MVDRLIKPDVIRSPLLLTLLALFVPGIGSAALAPAMPPAMENAGDKTETAPQAASAPGPVRAMLPQGMWMLPSMRLGGAVSYNVARSTSDGESQMQQSQDATLSAKFNGFLWAPWLAQYTCTANVIVSRSQSDSNGQSNSGQSVSTTGTGQLNLFARSAYPFEAHFSKYDGRYSNDLALSQAYAGQSFGFSQHFNTSIMQTSGGFDRHTQNDGQDQQDTAYLTVSANRKEQQLQIAANVARSSHDAADSTQSTQQNNLSVMQSLAPTETVSVQNMVSLSQSSYNLGQTEGSSSVKQLSSVAFWRPEEEEVTVTASARVLTLQEESVNTLNAGTAGRPSTRASNSNFNVGVNYDGIKNTRLNAGANLNLTQVQGVRRTSASQNVGIGYSPEAYDLGSFRYNWMTSASAGRSSGDEQASSLDTGVQLGHNLSRAFTLSQRSGMNLSFNQGINVSVRKIGAPSNDATLFPDGNTNATQNTNANNGINKYLTHGASLGWNLSGESASASAQLSASDGRSLNGDGEFFQAINFQVSSNMPTGNTASWLGNFTIQAVRQSRPDTAGFGPAADNSTSGAFITNSSGALSYQQQRLFGIRRLRLVSDLRLNSQALLPLLGGPLDQEQSAWETRFDYMIGRMQFRLNFLLSRMVTPATGVDPITGARVGSRTGHVAKSVSFSMSRAIGNM